MSTKLLAQLCQIGGAVQRGLLTKEAVAQALDVGFSAASGNSDAIEVQSAYEAVDGHPLSPEVEAEVGAKLQKLFPPKEAPKSPFPPNPLAGGSK